MGASTSLDMLDRMSLSYESDTTSLADGRRGSSGVEGDGLMHQKLYLMRRMHLVESHGRRRLR